MRPRLVPVLVLVVATLMLVASVALVMTRGDSWTAGGFAPGMMGYASSGGGEPVRDIGAARRQAQRFADRLDLRAEEVMQFDNQYYVELVDSEGRGATEVLVDPGNGAIAIEYGPAMMWNSRYGMMSGGNRWGSGMMGETYRPGRGKDPTWTPPPGRRKGAVAAADAEQIADRWARGSGMRAQKAEAFPGYYTVHTTRAGRVAGMVSVNSFTAAVWPHWWHGRLTSMSD